MNQASTAAGDPGRSDPGASEPGPLAEAGELVSLLRETAGRYADLFTAELRLAGLSVSMMLTSGVLLAVFVTGAWALLCAALAVGVWTAGFSLAACLLVLAIINIMAALAAVMALRALSRRLTFSATRRSLETQPGPG